MSSQAQPVFSKHNPIQVMLVDDSRMVRQALTEIIDQQPDMKVVASAANGKEAIHLMTENRVDVILLDVVMPVMDGITALPELLRSAPHTPIIMCSILTTKAAAVSLKALELGATDIILKPSSMATQEAFVNELQQKIRVFANNAVTEVNNRHTPLRPVAEPLKPTKEQDTWSLRPVPERFTMQALAIGASTGGPQALLRMLHMLDEKLPAVPIFVTQHMPPTFTTILADHITSSSNIACMEAADGEKVEKNKIYLAPGDYHMEIRHINGENRIHLTQEPPENFCRPSVNPMLRSLTKIYGAHLLTVILTGMGMDGLDGCKEVIEHRGMLIAQNKQTSTVWGMPGAVAKAGLCSAILPLDDIAPYIIGLQERKP